jgi:hypothetical protein
MGIVRVGGRGTTRRVSEKERDNWTGPAFREYQQKQKEAAGSKYITMGRGTTKIKFGDIVETSGRSSGKGMWVSSGRGTGRRKL